MGREVWILLGNIQISYSSNPSASTTSFTMSNSISTANAGFAVSNLVSSSTQTLDVFPDPSEVDVFWKIILLLNGLLFGKGLTELSCINIIKAISDMVFSVFWIWVTWCSLNAAFLLLECFRMPNHKEANAVFNSYRFLVVTGSFHISKH